MDAKCSEVLKAFLGKYCAEPELIEAEIKGLGLWYPIEIGPDEFVCRNDEAAEACWLIVSGQLEIMDGEHIVLRGEGEMVGEQGLLTTLLGKGSGRRSADIVARGPVKVVSFDASLQENFSKVAQTAWALTLAAVINEKLRGATRQRAELRRSITDRNALLARFAEGDALGLMQRAVDEKTSPVVKRHVIIWFSDVANFSTWAATQPPEEVARLARAIAGIQVDLIRGAKGQIDKLVGDGVMAVWLLGTAQRRNELASAAVECARQAEVEIRKLFVSEKLDGQLDLRVGLHAGEACFGDFGSKERIAVTVLGTDVNTAARYEQAKAEGLGSVRVSPELKKLIENSPDAGRWNFSGPISAPVKHGVVIDIYTPEQKGGSQ